MSMQVSQAMRDEAQRMYGEQERLIEKITDEHLAVLRNWVLQGHTDGIVSGGPIPDWRVHPSCTARGDWVEVFYQGCGFAVPTSRLRVLVEGPKIGPGCHCGSEAVYDGVCDVCGQRN